MFLGTSLFLGGCSFTVISFILFLCGYFLSSGVDKGVEMSPGLSDWFFQDLRKAISVLTLAYILLGIGSVMLVAYSFVRA